MAVVDFQHPENSVPGPEIEPATLGSEDQRQTNRAIQPLSEKLPTTNMDGQKIATTTTSTAGGKEAKRRFFNIDKEMIRFKAHFFLYYGGSGAMFPFMQLIVKNRIRISATASGIVFTVQFFVTVLSKIALGYVADYFKRMKIILSVLIITYCLCFPSLLAIPPIREPVTQTSTLFGHNAKYKNNSEIELFSKADCNATFYYNYEVPPNATAYSNENTKTSMNLLCTVCIENFNSTRSSVLCFKPEKEELFHSSVLTNNSGTGLLKKQLDFCYYQHFLQSKHFRINSSKLVEIKYSIIPESFDDAVNCSVMFSKSSRDYDEFRNVNDFKTYQFWIFACIVIVIGTCAYSINVISDTLCCESVQKHKRDFGQQRVYSALGWGVLSPLGGLLCDVTHDYYLTWTLMVISEGLCLWNLYKMDLVIPQFSQNIMKDVGKVLKSGVFLAYNFGNFINGLYTGIIWFYLIWYVSLLGGDAFLSGMIYLVQCFAGEIPFMFFSTWFIEKLGFFNISSLSLFLQGVRFLWYSYLQNPWWILPVEVIHGFTYGVFYVSTTTFGKLNAKKGTETTTLSILFSTNEGLGGGIGCILAGIGLDMFGGHQTFFYLSLLAFGSTVINMCITFLVCKCSSGAIDLTPSSKS